MNFKNVSGENRLNKYQRNEGEGVQFRGRALMILLLMTLSIISLFSDFDITGKGIINNETTTSK